VSTSIVPLSEIQPSQLADYLRGRGVPSEIIQWKYFDAHFNGSGGRGFAAVTDDRIRGLIGLIPFSLGRRGEEIPAAWSCDWSVQDHDVHPFVGVVLLRRAIDATGLLLALGGNANSQRLLRRVANVTVEGATRRFVLPLRIGAVRDGLERRFPVARLGHRSPHWNLAIPRRWRRGQATHIRWQEGAARAIEPLLGVDASSDWRPRYGFDYIDWQIGRCPAIDSWTCYFDDGSGPRAAALCWRLREDNGLWRIALWGVEEEREPLMAVLDGVVERVFRERGFIVSALVSRVDAMVAEVLMARGFRPAQAAAPLFVCGGTGPEGTVGEVADLSYLATDLAYRR
jgi:hypothetical protein